MKKRSAWLKLWCLLPLLAAVLLGRHLGGHPSMRSPHDEQPDLLSVLFGESRAVIGQRMYYLADVYYHLGVGYSDQDQDQDHDHHDPCHHHHGEHAHELFLFPFEDEEFPESAFGHDHDPGPGPDPGPDPDPGSDCDHYHEHAHDHRSEHGGDWWTRLNRRLKPREHRHLHGRREESEILPWLWAAVKVDPGHVNAYLDGSFFLADRLGQKEEGLRMLEEGLRHNPDSVQIYFAKGTMQFHQFEDREGAFETLEQGRRVWLEQWERWRQNAARGRQAEQPGTLLYYRLLAYMGRIAELQERTEQALALYAEALPFAPSPQIRNRLHEHIENLNLNP